VSPEFAISGEVRSQLPIYTIEMAAEALAALEENPFGQELQPAVFTHEGVSYSGVKIRHRGAWARTWPKKPLKIFLTEENSFEGQTRLNLNSSFRDPSFIREPLAYFIYERCGAPAPRSRLVRVHLNGHFRGLYVQVEQPDKAFANRLDLKGAVILKASSRMKQADQRALPSPSAYRVHYEQETQKKDVDGYAMLQAFCEELAGAKDALAFFEQRVDLEKYVNYLAATILCQNWDGFSKNHFLVYDRKGSGKWFVVPWDLDRSLGDHWDWSFGRADLPIELGTRAVPGVTGWNRLQDRFFSHPELRRRLAVRLHELLETEFTPEKLGPVIDQMQAAIESEAALDYKRWPNRAGSPWYRNDGVPVRTSIETVTRFVQKRQVFVRAELTRLTGGQPLAGQAQ
jgi:spore coat protein H